MSNCNRDFPSDVTLMGLGLHGGGVAAARYCAGLGARVTVTDVAQKDALADSLRSLDDIPIHRWVLDRHDEQDFVGPRAIVVNPAVRPDNHFVRLARDSGALVTSETELFLRACSAPVIAVTGTVGKTTTATMLYEILKSHFASITAGNATESVTHRPRVSRRAGKGPGVRGQAAARTHKTAWLGGNSGASLLPRLNEIQRDDIVVLELSSYQLHWLNDDAPWPSAAIVTNCSPNHLPWHSGWEHYRNSKQRLVRNAGRNSSQEINRLSFVVLNEHDAEVASWVNLTAAKRVSPWPLADVPPLRLPGEHNRQNAALAAAAAFQFGVQSDTITNALTNFAGLAYRLQDEGEFAGRRYMNDSKSTSPAATIAALATMDRPMWLLLGGADVGEIDLTPLLHAIDKKCRGVATFGSTGPQLIAALNQHAKTLPAANFATLAEAFAWCRQQSAPGDTILLSPAFPSTDQFRDFEQRGREFVRLIPYACGNLATK